MKWVGLWYKIFQLILRYFAKAQCWMPSFVDFGELLGMLSLDKAYPYLRLELQANSSFYLRALNLCAPQKVCYVLKIHSEN